jgi:hypothetical protein
MRKKPLIIKYSPASFLPFLEVQVGNLFLGALRVAGFHHSGGYEESYLLEHKAAYSVESQMTFRRNMSLSSSGLKSKPSKKQNQAKFPCCLLHVDLLFGLLLNSEDGGSIFLLDRLSADYTTSYRKKWDHSFYM